MRPFVRRCGTSVAQDFKGSYTLEPRCSIRYARAMRHHPDAVAHHLRQQSTWRDLQPRGDREHGAEDWTDACLAIAGCSPLAYAAFAWVHNADASSRRTLEHHLHAQLARVRLPDGLDPDVLVQLALDEQHAPENQRRDGLRAAVLGLSPSVWKRDYQNAHARLLGEISALVSDAWRVARARIDEAA
jgi:hypothetical protein